MLNESAEQVETLQNLLIAVATGGTGDELVYRKLREQVTSNPALKDLVPRFLRTYRSTNEFWPYIKSKYPSYAERRAYIREEFRPLFERVEGGHAAPSDKQVSEILHRFDSASVHQVWMRALERRENDPEGAITLARTLIESVCKHILDEKAIDYKRDSDLTALYQTVARSLNIAPSQHSEPIFKQILGGCTGIVEGLGALRNRLSDAHGQGKRPVKPAARHAELAVNLAATEAIFLIATRDISETKTQS